ncbi:putative h-type lectin domain-containing protein [Eutypa lata UCREL1]|uniref:Putative h-type lectin domain-containing protein n=1 Tax=Eutypa lata (strain UCR-EL1) TaxID=1287681 RepID=M7SAT5_EUTLA|nr:putative h-type lectin domain-containing protein [Eutypa lata UCREL1]
MTPQGPIQQLRLLWPDGTGERDDQSSTADQECDDSDNIFPAPECQSCGKRGTPVRPQVIVNVLSTGGSSGGGVGVGVGAVGHVTPVPLLEAQVVELLRKVEHLSAQRAARELVVETGTWNTMDVRPWQKPEQSTKGRITFLRKFRFPPAVTTSICSLDASRSQNLRIKVYATDIIIKTVE